ncbi:uncharacterized protein LOC127078937 [Lathyrus oleraceus]|uniref:uncharacterized protein LOC127078937 n=1 Tax=Pisum sativum TaxID=3888 RepID=UPI0021D3DB29|nr:uncharacterized protein LOC127078937 [Pisum sativum]
MDFLLVGFVTYESSDITKIFSTAEKFDTQEEVTRWIREAGIRNRVTIIITHSDIKTGKRGRSDKVIFDCGKYVKYKQGDSVKQSATKKCGCPFKTRSTPSKDGSGWKIDVKNEFHNHGLSDRFEGHSLVGRLNADEQQHIIDLTKCHVLPRHILLSLQ